ncbi:hypothetical protein HPB52_023741 [Rhipicephalus sanguineus]|uniref:Tick transposon n=1 Tax=Rhipicephalus sanguineus TaxID=34632 RepID=A0A9D4T251_RHISA|nr:hypothetical protein HPB52_023741 [Rhipicephalus sanguineus]
MESILCLIQDVASRSRSPHVVVAGDFNAKHRAWGPRAGDDRGAQVMEFAAAVGLVVLNNPQSEPTYETAYAASWIDVTLATPSALTNGYSWDVRSDVTYSEHKNIAVRIGDTDAPVRKRLTRYAQAQLLRQLATEPWFDRVAGIQPRSPEALDSVLEAFYRMLDGHVRRNLRPARKPARGNSRWTPELAQERKKVNVMRRRYQRTTADDVRALLRMAYSAALARFRLRVKEAKSAYETEWKLLVGLAPPRFLPPLKRKDGSMTTTHLESAALLLETQIAVDDPRSDASEHIAIRRMADDPYYSAVVDAPFTETEVSDVVAAMPPRSSPGPDALTPLMVKGLFRTHPQFILRLFNAALALGYFPRCWRRGRIIFIPKPGRPPDRTTSYRPICVTSVFGKTLERLLNARLYHFLWTNGHIHRFQYGFTHSRSALMALVRLRDTLIGLRASRTPAKTMSLDFQGAFDSVWHPRVLAFFREKQVPANLYHLLRTFLQHRSVVFRSHAGELEAFPSLGSPQGSPLSPMLWNVIIHDLLCLPLPPGVTVQAYADDTIIVIPAESRERLGELGSAVLRQVVDWTVKAKVVLSTEKTYCLLFPHGRRGLIKQRPAISLDPQGKNLEFRDSLRILGVVFDSRLSFFKHADYLKEKTELLLAKTGTLARMQGGILRPEQKVLMRAPPITLELARVNAEFRLFVERKPSRYGDLSFDPVEVLPPLDAWHEHPAERSAYPHRRLSRDGARRLARLPGLHVYTDGSYSERLAGAAFVVIGSHDRIGAVGRFRVERATSAFGTEVIAVLEALRHIHSRGSASVIRIYTDCLSLLQAISQHNTTDPRIRDIKILLGKISGVSQVTLYHVPGHSGLFGNELADFLAARAAQCGEVRHAPLTPRAVRKALRAQTLHLWGKEWMHHSDTDLFKWVPCIPSIPAWFPPNQALVTFLTGHGRFPSYFHRFNLIAAPTCSCGLNCQGTDHYLYECPSTRSMAGQLQPREALERKDYVTLLRCAKNRALFIRLVRLVGDTIPDINQVARLASPWGVLSIRGGLYNITTEYTTYTTLTRALGTMWGRSRSVCHEMARLYLGGLLPLHIPTGMPSPLILGEEFLHGLDVADRKFMGMDMDLEYTLQGLITRSMDLCSSEPGVTLTSPWTMDAGIY